MISIVGNDKLAVTIENFIKAKRIPHAILIEGEYGTGKHTLASFLTKAILCESENAPCLSCKHCHLADISSHPDITVISPEDGKKNIAVSQIRELRNETVIKPHSALKRVFIIDCADTMNPNAQNALLKVLEEPPKTVMFILLAENKSALLDTIISRCVTLSITVPEFSVAYDYIKSTTNFEKNLIEKALEDEKNNIGRALDSLNGVSSEGTVADAEAFLNSAINCDRYTMLKIALNYQKSRIGTDSFIKDLKFLIAKKIRLSPNSVLSKPLLSIYEELGEFQSSLITNINLNLLFSNLTSSMTEHIRRNK
jgi:DNA polymerase III delta' subunit